MLLYAYILISLCILHAFIWISSVCKSIPLAPSVLNGFEGTSQMTSAAHFIHQMENLNGRYPSSPLEARYLAGPSNVCVNHYLQSTKPAGIDFLISSHRSMKSYRKKNGKCDVIVNKYLVKVFHFALLDVKNPQIYSSRQYYIYQNSVAYI